MNGGIENGSNLWLISRFSNDKMIVVDLKNFTAKHGAKVCRAVYNRDEGYHYGS